MSVADGFRGHQELLVLEAVRSGPVHGYGIIQQLHWRSDGVFELAEGSIYPVLRKLEAEGLVKSRWSQESGRRRRVYELTRKGHQALGEQREAWFNFSAGMNAVLGAPV
jgi:PadR family transcriptional regulator, regulatory protein PadR